MPSRRFVRENRKNQKDYLAFLSFSIFCLYTHHVMKYFSVTNRINQNGRIVIPFRIRRAMGIEPRDSVTMTFEDGLLRIEPHKARIKRIQAEMKKFARSGASASEQLASERREETRMEMEEWLG